MWKNKHEGAKISQHFTEQKCLSGRAFEKSWLLIDSSQKEGRKNEAKGSKTKQRVFFPPLLSAWFHAVRKRFGVNIDTFRWPNKYFSSRLASPTMAPDPNRVTRYATASPRRKARLGKNTLKSKWIFYVFSLCLKLDRFHAMLILTCIPTYLRFAAAGSSRAKPTPRCRSACTSTRTAPPPESIGCRKSSPSTNSSWPTTSRTNTDW